MTVAKYFMTATEVARYLNDPANTIVSIVSITFDTSSGQYVLFYTT